MKNLCILKVGNSDGLKDGLVEDGGIVGHLLGFLDGETQKKEFFKIFIVPNRTLSNDI